PEASASSTPYWMIGLSTSGSISFGCAFVAGRNRVPRPAAGKNAFRTPVVTPRIVSLEGMLDPTYVREPPGEVRTGLQNRGLDADAILEPLTALDGERRALIPKVEGLKRDQNAAAERVAQAKKQGLDPSAIFAENKARGQQIKELEAELERVE